MHRRYKSACYTESVRLLHRVFPRLRPLLSIRHQDVTLDFDPGFDLDFAPDFALNFPLAFLLAFLAFSLPSTASKAHSMTRPQLEAVERAVLKLAGTKSQGRG